MPGLGLRDFEGNARLGDRPLGPDDALRDCRLGTTYARAISATVRPPTRRSVSAARAGTERTG